MCEHIFSREFFFSWKYFFSKKVSKCIWLILFSEVGIHKSYLPDKKHGKDGILEDEVFSVACGIHINIMEKISFNEHPSQNKRLDISRQSCTNHHHYLFCWVVIVYKNHNYQNSEKILLPEKRMLHNIITSLLSKKMQLCTCSLQLLSRHFSCLFKKWERIEHIFLH